MAGLVHSLQTSLSPWGGRHQQLLTQSNWFNQSKHYAALCSAKPEHLPLSLAIPESQLPLSGFSVQPSLGVFLTIPLFLSLSLSLCTFSSPLFPSSHSSELMRRCRRLFHKRRGALYKDNCKQDMLITHLRKEKKKKKSLYRYLLMRVFRPRAFRSMYNPPSQPDIPSYTG